MLTENLKYFEKLDHTNAGFPKNFLVIIAAIFSSECNFLGQLHVLSASAVAICKT